MDSSIILSQVQHADLPVITLMNSELYKAAEDGEMEPFNKYQGSLLGLVDGRQNTALHIYLRTREDRAVKNDTSFVEQLVEKCPSLLLQPNEKGEIPLHIAGQHCNHETVECLIERAKLVSLPHEDLEKGISCSDSKATSVRKMVTMKDCEGNTAFHKAAGSGEVELVRVLVKELDPDFTFSANKSGETPLYIAAKKTCCPVVAEILDNCKSIDYGGPHGTTALHAAIFENGTNEMILKLIEARKELTKEADDEGRTPLHYAAYFGWSVAANVLLEVDASTAYIKDKHREMTALHMATLNRHIDVMVAIISHCPGCVEVVDGRGWNFLHIAVARLSSREMKRFLHGISNKIRFSTIANLLNEKDADGNSPFDVLINFPANKFDFPIPSLFNVPKEDLDYSWPSEIKKEQIQKVLKDIANNVQVAGKPIHDLRKHMKKMEAEDAISEQEILDKGRETHLVVVALIATVTFAAGFTVPGGYNDEKGTAILSRDSFFRAFVVTDTVAFVSSLLAIFVHFLYPSLIKRGRHLLDRWLRLADWLTFLAMIAMAVAFVTGTVAVLKSSKWFSLSIYFLGLLFFPGLYVASYRIFFKSKLCLSDTKRVFSLN